MKQFLLPCFLFLISYQLSLSQSFDLTGQVTDQDQTPLSGVNIIIDGTQKGTITDANGNYSIKVNENDQLIFSYLGYTSQEVNITKAESINIVLLPHSDILDEVIITAYGVEKGQRKLGYSAQDISGDRLIQTGENNFINSLNGHFAGINITPAGGGAGAGTNIVIRGYSSISGNNQPLFVVDGVPINNNTDIGTPDGNSSDFRNAYLIARGNNRAIDLNQFDIESISILKGGAATAIYGSRANNGVVLITTKKGRKGFQANLTSTVDFSQIAKSPEIQSRFAQGSGGAFIPSNTQNYGPAYEDNPVFPEGTIIDLNQDGTLEDVSGQPIPDNSGYYDEFWRTGISYNNTLSLSGGNEFGTFYSSMSYIDQESILPNDGFEKLSFLLKGDYNLTPKLKFGASANFIETDLTSFATGYRGPAYALATIFNSVYDLDDPWKDEFGNTTFYIKDNFKTTPTWIVNEEPELSNIRRIIGNVRTSYQIVPGLSLNYQLGVDSYNEKRKLYRPIGSPFALEGELYDVYIQSRDLNSDLTLTGESSLLGNNLKINYLIGNNIFESNFDRSFIYGSQLNLNGFNDISNAKEVSVTNSIQRRRIIGAFAQLDISYRYLLFLELSARNDWSSTLPKDNNSYLYPSASLGFAFSELISASWLSLGKIRGSIAQVGNDAPIYATTNTYFLSRILNGQSAFTITNQAKNSNIQPEISTTWEIGTDLYFFDERVGLNFTYYNRTTKDQIALASLPGSTGYASYILNAGEIENKGVEVTLSFNDLLRRSNGLNWNMAFNFTKNENTVLAIPEDLNEIIIGNSAWFGASIIVKPGLPYGSISGSYYERTEDGQLYIGDDGFPIKSSDRKVLGDPNPDWRLNYFNSLSYKNWTFDFLFDVKQGGMMFNESRLAMWFYGSDIEVEDIGKKVVFEGVVKSTGESNTQEVELSESYFKSKKSFVDEPAMEDASWVRLRNVSLSYNINPSWLEKSFIKNIQLSVSGRNLWIMTDYSGTDPEAASVLGPGNVQSIDLFAVPGTKSYTFSLRANF